MTQDEKEKSDHVKVSKASGDKRSKQRRGRVLKVVIRRLPPSMCEEDFLEQMSPLPEHESFYFVPADSSGMSGISFGRAYIALRDHQEVVNFRDKWDGYVFLDERGQDYPAVVEFAPFQKMPRKKPKKADNKNATIEQDAEFQKFVETMDVEEEVDLPSLEATVEELERRDRELRANNGVPNVLTPLIEFVLAKKMEKVRIREEKKRKDAERKRTDKRRNKRDHTARTARENTIREESDEDAMSIEDDSHRMMDIRQRFEEPHANGRGNDRDRGNNKDRDRAAGVGGGGGGDRGADRSGEGIREKTGRRERNRRGNKDNKKGQGAKANQNNANHQSDNNNNRGVNEDDEVSGPSPVAGRQGGARERDHRDGVDRHAKYYDDPREPKSSNQRRNARAHDGEGDHYADEPKPSRREKKARDRERARDKGKIGGGGGIASDNNNRSDNRRNRGNDRDDRRDPPHRDEDRWQSEDKIDRIEGRRHPDKDDRAGDHKEDRRQREENRDKPDRENHSDTAGPSRDAADKDDRAGSGARGGEQRDRDNDRGERLDRRDRPDRNERTNDRRGDKGDNQKKGNQRERRENNRKKDGDKDGEYRDGSGGGAKARPPKMSGGARGGGDRREDRPSTSAAKRDQPKPASKRYSDTRPAPLGKSKALAGDGEGATAEEASARCDGYDEGPGEARGSEHSREPQGLRPIPRPSHKEDGGKKIRNKFRPAMEIYKPGSTRRKNDPDREGKSSSPDPQ